MQRDDKIARGIGRKSLGKNQVSRDNGRGTAHACSAMHVDASPARTKVRNKACCQRSSSLQGRGRKVGNFHAVKRHAQGGNDSGRYGWQNPAQARLVLGLKSHDILNTNIVQEGEFLRSQGRAAKPQAFLDPVGFEVLVHARIVQNPTSKSRKIACGWRLRPNRG